MNAIKEMTQEEIISGLRETMIYLAICCYSEDKAEQEKVERMATSIHHAIEKLKGED